MADFLTTLQHFESGGRNVPNTTQGTSSGQAQGYNQITTGTWKEFGGTAYAPTPLQATQEQQNAIAAKIPLGRWAPETLAYLKNNGFSVDPKATLAANIAANHGTLGTAPPPHTATPGTTINTTGASTTPAGGPGAPAAPGQPAAPSGGLAGQLATALKPLTPGGKGAGGDAGGGDQPPPMQLQQGPPARPVGGPMMMGMGGLNAPRPGADQALAQLAAAGSTRLPVQPMMPGQASGVTGLPGTTLNSPSQLQMALMTGQISPYDMYANNPAFGSGFGS